MRKLLLSTMAGIVAAVGLADMANAQTPPPGTTYTVVPKAGVPKPPAPGTIAVSIGALFQWQTGFLSASGQTRNGQKLSSYTSQGFTRLFLGMDGQSTNGILYGAFTQIRQNFGAPSAGTTGQGASAGSGNSTLFVRTGFMYIGAPSVGKLQVGAGPGPATAFALGMFEGFNDGAWNGNFPNFVPSNTIPLYPYVDNGVLYTTDKIAYFSPNFAGFDFGVSWEPAYVTLNNSTSCTDGAAGALSTCDNLSSSNVAGDAGKRKNTFDVEGRYRGTFGPVGVAVSGGLMASGTVNETGASQRFRGLDLGHVGTEITIAGLMFGGHYLYGNQNGQWNLEPVGGKTSQVYMAGVQYTTGPIVVGASYFNNQGTGDFSAPAREGQRVDVGVAAGGYYALTPGIGIFLAYLYGQRKQSGYDFLANAVGPNNNQVRSQAAGIGISTQW